MVNALFYWLTLSQAKSFDHGARKCMFVRACLRACVRACVRVRVVGCVYLCVCLLVCLVVWFALLCFALL